MLTQGTVGPATVQDGAMPAVRQGKSGEVVVQELHGRFYEQVYRGNVYMVSDSNRTGIAWVGGAAGIPQFALWNPTGSGKNAVILGFTWSIGTSPTSSGSSSVALWFGQTAAITQATKQNPVNMLTLAAVGSVMTNFVNVALTNSTAVTNVVPLGSVAAGAPPATGPTAGVGANFVLEGMILIPPGSVAGFGASNNIGLGVTAAMIWEEVPI